MGCKLGAVIVCFCTPAENYLRIVFCITWEDEVSFLEEVVVVADRLVVEEEEHFQVEVVEGQNSMEEVEEEHWHIVEGEH